MGNTTVNHGVLTDSMTLSQLYQQMKDAEEQYRQLLEDINDGYVLYSDYKWLYANGKMAQILGCEVGELIGRPAEDFLLPGVPYEARRDVLAKRGDNYKRKTGQAIPPRCEITMRAKDGSEIPVEMSFKMTSYEGKDALAIIVRDITEQKRLRENIRSFASQIIKVQEEERRHLARELHDGVMQELLALSHRLQDLVSGSFGQLPGKSKQEVNNARQMVDHTLLELRYLSQNLRPAILDDMGMLPAIRWLADKVRAQHNLEVYVEVIGDERRLPPEIELILFRIAQEALNNVAKHAEASCATVTIGFGADEITISVSDDGKGFELPASLSDFASEAKLGLMGISERIRPLGGKLDIESQSKRGTAIRAKMPYSSSPVVPGHNP